MYMHVYLEIQCPRITSYVRVITGYFGVHWPTLFGYVALMPALLGVLTIAAGSPRSSYHKIYYVSKGVGTGEP